MAKAAKTEKAASKKRQTAKKKGVEEVKVAAEQTEQTAAGE